MTDYTKDKKMVEIINEFMNADEFHKYPDELYFYDDIEAMLLDFVKFYEQEMILHNCKPKIQEYQNIDEKRNMLIDFLATINGYLVSHPHLQFNTRFIDEYLEKKK